MVTINASCTAIFVFLFSVIAGGGFQNDVKEPVIDSEERMMVDMINDYREERGLGRLQTSIALTRAADWMTNDMAANDIFGHTDSLGRGPGERIGAFGYKNHSYRGENLAAGFADAERTFNQWKESPSHNAAMLHPKFKVIGISRVKNDSSQYKWYWASDFGGHVDKTFESLPNQAGQ
jgi:uncharacterized protein YkwD